MKNKIVRRMDKEGRINIPDNFFKITTLKKGDIALLVSRGVDMIALVPMAEVMEDVVKYHAVVGQVTVSRDKGRIVIPKELRDSIFDIEVFVYEGYVTLRNNF